MDPYFGQIEEITEQNKNFRQVLFTGQYCQLVVMSLGPGEEIGAEVHPQVDQFFRIEEGEGKVVVGESEEHLVTDGMAFVIPAGTKHNIINTSTTEALKLYTIYSPPNHPEGTIHATKAEAMAAEAEEHQEAVAVEEPAVVQEPPVSPEPEADLEPPVEPEPTIDQESDLE